MPSTHSKSVKRVFIEEGCIPCSACEAECPQVFDVQRENTYIRPGAEAFFSSHLDQIESAADGCPVCVIVIEYSDGSRSPSYAERKKEHEARWERYLDQKRSEQQGR